MPRFTVPVMITLTAKDAQHAQHTVECSSVTSLEIPGLIRIAVGAAAPLSQKTPRSCQHRARQAKRNTN